MQILQSPRQSSVDEVGAAAALRFLLFLFFFSPSSPSLDLCAVLLISLNFLFFFKHERGFGLLAFFLACRKDFYSEQKK